MLCWNDIYDNRLIKKLEFVEPSRGAIYNSSIFKEYLAVYSEDNTLAIYNMNSAKQIFTCSIPVNDSLILEWDEDCVLSIKNNNLESLYQISTRDFKLLSCYQITVNEESITTQKINFNYGQISALGNTLIAKLNNEKTWEIQTDHTYIRKIKPLGNDSFVTFGRDNLFIIWRISNRTVEQIFKGTHNNWVLAVLISNGNVYSTGIDSIIRVWDLERHELKGILPVKRGWIFSLDLYESTLIFGLQNGEVYHVNTEEIINKNINEGAIWNIFCFENNVFSVSEGGHIVIRTLDEGRLLKTIKQSEGWVNNIAYSEYLSKYVAVTSRGEIILVDKSLDYNAMVTIGGLWFNSLIILEHFVWIVSAEGCLLKYDLENQIECVRLQLSNYQLIDITYDAKKDVLLVASVEGELFEVKSREYTYKVVIQLENIHFTSLSFDPEDSICFISTLEGDIIKYSNETKGILLSKRIQLGRIWKVSADPSNKSLSIISINRVVQVLAYDLELVYHTISQEELITTCLWNNGQLLLGNEKGEVYCFVLNIPNDTQRLQSLQSKAVAKYDRRLEFDFKKGIHLFFDKSYKNDTYKDRDIEILESCGLPYIVVDVTGNEVLKRDIVQRSGWSKFPQILFWGSFISSASVISEMFHSNCLTRVVNNLRKSEYGK